VVTFLDVDNLNLLVYDTVVVLCSQETALMKSLSYMYQANLIAKPSRGLKGHRARRPG